MPQDGRSPCRDGVTWEAGNANMTECVTVNVHTCYSRAPFPPLNPPEGHLTTAAPHDAVTSACKRNQRNPKDPPLGGLATCHSCEHAIYRQVNQVDIDIDSLALVPDLALALVLALGRACTHLAPGVTVEKRTVGCLEPLVLLVSRLHHDIEYLLSISGQARPGCVYPDAAMFQRSIPQGKSSLFFANHVCFVR